MSKTTLSTNSSSTSEMESSKDSLLPYAGIWKMIRETFPLIFESVESENTEKKNIDRLRKVMMNSPEVCYLYVPQSIIPREKYLQSVLHYIDFARGSLGDFVKVLYREDMAELHDLSVATQISVLNYLANRNQKIFTLIIKEYILCIKDLICGRANFRKKKDLTEFSFSRFMSTTNSELSKEYRETPFIITSSSSCIRVLSLVLKVIQTQLSNFNRCYPLSMKELWRIVLDLGIEDNNMSIQVAVLSTLTTMILEQGFPDDYMQYSKLCMYMKGIIRYVMMNYKGDCSSNTLISLLFKSLCEVFDAVVKTSDLKVEYIDVLLKIVLTILSPDSPFLHTEIISRSSCRLIQFLLERSQTQVNLEDKLNTLVPLLINCHSLLLIFQHVIYKDLLDKEFLSKTNSIQPPENNCNHDKLNCETSVRNAVMECFEEIRIGQMNKEQFTKKIKFLVMYFKMLTELHLQIQHHLLPVTFLDETIFKSVLNILLTLHTKEYSKDVLLNIIKICQYVLFLPEVSNLNTAYMNVILFFLFIPWVKEMEPMPQHTWKTHLCLIKQMEQYNLIYDIDVMNSCLKAFAYVEGGSGLNYRKTAMKIGMYNPQLISSVLKCVPYLISSCTAKDSASIVFDILVIGFESSDSTVQLILSHIVPLTICALSGKCNIVKGAEGSEEEFKLNCKFCDNDLKLENVSENIKVEHLLPIVTQYITLSKSTAEVREKVAESLRRLTNHLQELNCPELLSRMLHFMEDSEHKVRMAFSKVAPHLVFSKKIIQNSNLLQYKDNKEKAELQKSIDRFIQLAFSTVFKSVKTSDCDNMLLQYSVMATIYNVGCVPVHDVLLPIIKMYTLLISHPNMMNLSVAQIHLKGIASAHKQTIQDIFYRLQDEICQVLVTMLVHNFISNPSTVSNTLVIIAQSFGFLTVKELIECTFEDQILKYLLPWLVKKPPVKDLLYIVGESAYERERIPGCINKAFQNIYPHVFLFESDTVVAEINTMIAQLTQTNTRSLVYCSFKVIICELLLYIHKKKDRITEALIEMKKLESELEIGRLTNLMATCENQLAKEKIKAELKKTLEEERKTFTTNKDIANFIQPRFLGVLAFLDGKLVSSYGCESDKKNVLLALPDLIKIMGTDHITPVRYKVLATLRSALNLYKDYYPHLILSAFLSYVQNVKPSALGPLMSTIFICLLPLLDQFPVEIGSVFNILVIQNFNAVSSHLADLYFLPDLPPTHDVYNLVQQELAILRSAPVKVQLKATVRQVLHENTEVRLLGLKRLCKELSLYRQEIAGFIFENDTMDRSIIELLDVLITVSRDHKDDVLLACGECLGEFGALDPGHLPNKISLNVDSVDGTEVNFKIDSDTFIIGSLKELVRAFQAANHTIVMDRFALAIQELIKIYDIPKSREDVWNSLPEATKEIIIPLFNSRYVNSNSNDTSKQSAIPHPIFGNLKNCDWQAWAFDWISKLIALVTDEMALKVFTYCKLGFKNDMQTLLFFLPYVLLYAILSATENELKIIAEEVNAVLFWTEDKPNKKVAGFKIKIVGSTLDEDKSTFKDYIITHKFCTKTVYELFDFLHQWLRQTKTTVYKDRTSVPNIQNVERVIEFTTFSAFLNSFSKLETAQVAYVGKDYTRALLYLEEYVIEQPDMLQEVLPLFMKIYSALNEPDSFKGIIAIHETEPTVQEMILYHEVTNQLQDAAACYEYLSQQKMCNEAFHKSIVQCYLQMDLPATALHVAEGLLSSWEERAPDLLDERAEAMLSLSMYDELEELLSKQHMTHNSGWGVRLGQSLLHLRKGEGQQMLTEVNNMRIDLVRALSTTSITECEYRQGYDIIVKLHILNEFEKLGNMVLKMQNVKGPKAEEALVEHFKQLVNEELADRLKLMHPSCRVLHPVLCTRRVVLTLAHQMLESRCPNIGDIFLNEIGKNWLKSIEVTRKSNSVQQAYSNIITAEKYKPKGLFIEKAKLLWLKGEPDTALTALKRGIEKHYPDASTFKTMSETERQEDRKLCAETKLLIATYNDENVNVDLDKNLTNYKDAVDVYRYWEKSVVCLAQYEYKVLRAIIEKPDCSSKIQDFQARVINHFGKSLEYGCEYIYQSIPRMLSMWLDCGAQLAQEIKPNRNTIANIAEKKAHMVQLTEIVESYVKQLPTYIFMTAFSQLISRICHPLPECYKVLKDIIVRIIIAYPQQALWMFISVYKSKYKVRKNRCEEVLRSHEIQKRPELYRLIKDFKELAEKLYELANKTINGSGNIKESIKKFYLPLYEIVTNPNLSSILIPLQRFRTIRLPRSTNAYKDHFPFPEDLVYICGMKDEVHVLASLQRPKKIILIGSDGKQHPVLCKPKDDIRLDARMMEFSSIINLYLHRDPEARNRGLHIRTYSAVPLTDDCGLIEWLPNLEGLRPIMMKIYKEKGLTMTATETKSVMCKKTDPHEKKIDVFVNKLLPRHPPVLREWFLKQFHHPTAWYLARSAYVRTTAVMSIVGNILGLGDRHGENILLDLTCGDLIHVDFGCLFNKGEHFEWPERVPFRLTHNMVSAMGPTGVEGMFKHACENTTRIMRQQIDQLMSVLRPFLYDPLVCWNNKISRDENSEMTNEKAVEVIQNIEMRIQGILRRREKPMSIALSVEGQVRCLIQEATSIDNLCQMFNGWGPYL